MSSILTNNSAMNALQTLRGINRGMSDVQNQINTGKMIGSAKDNAAIWSIAATMETDVAGFKSVSESLNLGNSTLEVARKGTETIKSQLEELKATITTAQTPGVDRFKLQQAVEQKVGQIQTVVESASFNGVSMLKGNDDVAFLASLNRDANGSVTTSNISFQKQDMTTDVAKFGTKDATTSNVAFGLTTRDTASFDITGFVNGNATTTGSIEIGGTSITTANIAASGNATAAGDAFVTAINGNTTMQGLGISATNNAGVVTIQTAGSGVSATAANLTLTAGGTGGTAFTGSGITDSTIASDSTALRSDGSQSYSGLTGTVGTSGDLRFAIGANNVDVAVTAGDTIDVVKQKAAAAINADANAQAAGISASLDESGELVLTNKSGSDVSVTTSQVNSLAGLSGTGAATIAASTATAKGDGTAIFSVAGDASSDGAGSVTVAGVQVTVNVTSGQTAEEQASSFAAAINNNTQLQELGISARGDKSGAVSVETTNKFSDFEVTNLTNSAGGTSTVINDGKLGRRSIDVDLTNVAVKEGQGYQITVNNQAFDYVAKKGDTMTDVAKGFESMINGDKNMVSQGVEVKLDLSGGNPKVMIGADNDGNAPAVAIASNTTAADGTAAGGLRGLESLDVTTADGAKAALGRIEGLIQNTLSASSAIGSAQERIDSQTTFVKDVMDGMKAGVGALVDADMEAVSARLQALQVQQQLGVQALSIANQQPQSILSLFR